MASKLQYIYELSENVSRNLSGYENWTAFLKSAAWQYKYPFHDQLLIYAQRPDATACASIDVWNKRLHSWIMLCLRYSRQCRKTNPLRQDRNGKSMGFEKSLTCGTSADYSITGGGRIVNRRIDCGDTDR